MKCTQKPNLDLNAPQHIMSKHVMKNWPFIAARLLLTGLISAIMTLHSEKASASLSDSLPELNTSNLLPEFSSCPPNSGSIFSIQDPRHFTPQSAYLFLQLAKLSDTQNIALAEAQLKAFGFEDFVSLDNDETNFHALLFWNHDTAFLSFRGTRSKKQAATNMKFTPRTSKEAKLAGKMHAGFLDEYESGRHILLAALEKEIIPRGIKSIYLTGHSRGGVLAEMAAKEISQLLPLQVEAIYTLGQPRGGNEDFAADSEQKFGSTFFRVEMDGDITPQVPPTANGAEFSTVIIADYFPQLKLMIRQLVRSLGFAHSAGQSFAIDEESSRAQPITSPHQREQREYQRLARVLHIDALDRLAPSLSQYISAHQPHVYECALAKGL